MEFMLIILFAWSIIGYVISRAFTRVAGRC
jgi:hypothetical protein